MKDTVVFHAHQLAATAAADTTAGGDRITVGGDGDGQEQDAADAVDHESDHGELPGAGAVATILRR